MSDVLYNPLEFAQVAGAQDTPPAGQTSVYARSDGKMYLLNSNGDEDVLVNHYIQVVLSANVLMPLADTGYNLLSLVLSEGEWLVGAQCVLVAASINKENAVARIWDTTDAGTIAQGEQGYVTIEPFSGNAGGASVVLTGVQSVVAGTTKTLVLTAYSTTTNATARQYPSNNGAVAPNGAVTKLYAVRLK